MPFHCSVYRRMDQIKRLMYLPHLGSIHKGCLQILLVFSCPPSPCLRLSAFCLTAFLPLSVWTLSWKTIKELQKLWENRNSLRKTCVLYFFLLCLFIAQSPTQEDGEKMTSRCPLSLPETTLVHLHLNTLPLSTLVRIVASPLPPPRCGNSL